MSAFYEVYGTIRVRQCPEAEVILDRLAANPRGEVAILYHTPVERAVLDAHPAFELAAELGFGLVYKEVPVGRRILGCA